MGKTRQRDPHNAMRAKLHRSGMKTGKIIRHLDEAKLAYLARSVPPEMDIAEWLLGPVLNDAMADDNWQPIGGFAAKIRKREESKRE